MKTTYLDYVLLTEEEYSRLLEEWGEFKLNKCIEKLDNYIPNSQRRKPYKDHNRVLRDWVNDWYKKNYPNMNAPEKAKEEEIEVSDEAKKKTAELFRKLGEEKFGMGWKQKQKVKNQMEEEARNKQVEENYKKSMK